MAKGAGIVKYDMQVSSLDNKTMTEEIQGSRCGGGGGQWKKVINSIWGLILRCLGNFQVEMSTRQLAAGAQKREFGVISLNLPQK